MTEYTERIRITADKTDILVRFDGGSDMVTLDGHGDAIFGSDGIPTDVLDFAPTDQPDEYVISLEFDRDDETAFGLTTLQRLDIHVRDLTVQLRESGYTIDGTLTGWIGYTNRYGRG